MTGGRPAADREAAIRRSVDAFVRRDFEAVLALYLPTAAWDTSPTGGPVFEGHEALRSLFVEWTDPYVEIEQELEEFRDLGGGVTFGMVAQRGQLDGSDGWISFPYAGVATWAGGCIERVTVYADIEEARAAAERLAEEREGLAELVRRSSEPANTRDYEEMMRYWQPDGVWDLTPLGLGAYEGGAAVRGFLEDWFGAYDDLRIEIEEIRDLGAGVAFVVLAQSARPAGSVGSVALRYASVAIWRDGLIVRCTQYSDIDQARADAAKLAEQRRQRRDL